MRSTLPADEASDKPTPFQINIWIGFLLANTLVGALSLAFALHSRQQFQERATELSDNLLQGITQSFGAKFDHIRMAEAALAATLEQGLARGGIDRATASTLIQHFNSHDIDGNSMRVSDERGILILGAGSDAWPPYDFSDRDYFHALSQNPALGSIVTRPVIGKVSHVPVILLVHPYTFPDHRLAGVITDTIRLEDIRAMLRLPAPKADDVFELIDARDLSLILKESGRTSLDYTAAHAYPVAPEIKKAVARATAPGSLIPHGKALHLSEATLNDGNRIIAALVKIPNTPFVALVGIGHASHFAEWRELATLLSVFAAFFLAISWVLTRALLRHENLSRTAEKSRDALNASLEGLVVERTADLEQALDRIRQSRSELADAERLASLGAMVAGVAHELNTPLGNALLTASTLQSQAGELLCALDVCKQGSAPAPLRRSELLSKTRKIQELSDLQAQSIARAADLVRAFKQVAVDQASSRRREFDLREALDSVVASYRPSLARASCDISVELSCPTGILCDSFPGALMQISTNMLQNAQRHAFDGRERGAFRIDCQVDPATEHAIIVFSDDGVGMSSVAASHAFEQFFTTKPDDGGSGIGLSLSQQLAKSALGGSLAFTPKDEGAAFTLRFPVRHP